MKITLSSSESDILTHRYKANFSYFKLRIIIALIIYVLILFLPIKKRGRVIMIDGEAAVDTIGSNSLLIISTIIVSLIIVYFLRKYKIFLLRKDLKFKQKRVELVTVKEILDDDGDLEIKLMESKNILSLEKESPVNYIIKKNDKMEIEVFDNSAILLKISRINENEISFMNVPSYEV